MIFSALTHCQDMRLACIALLLVVGLIAWLANRFDDDPDQPA